TCIDGSSETGGPGTPDEDVVEGGRVGRAPPNRGGRGPGGGGGGRKTAPRGKEPRENSRGCTRGRKTGHVPPHRLRGGTFVGRGPGKTLKPEPHPHSAEGPRSLARRHRSQGDPPDAESGRA